MITGIYSEYNVLGAMLRRAVPLSAILDLMAPGATCSTEILNGLSSM